MRRRKFNKPLATALSFIFCLSLAGCGKKEVVVDDYGQGANTEQSTSTDAEEYATGDGKTLQDKFGKWAKWNDSFSIQGMSAKVNTSIPIPDSDYLNVYKQKELKIEKEDEERIVKSLFGDTGKKLEEIKYTNDTDYITFLYKYREMLHIAKGDQYTYFSDGEAYREIQGAINSSFEEVYKWVDEDTYYIHMYEGKYEGMRYGLLIACDHNTGTYDIFFDPISIKEYFPNNDFKTLIYDGNGDTLEKSQNIKNECTLSKEEVIKKAENFISENIGLNDVDNNIIENGDSYHMMLGLPAYAYVDDRSMTRLKFTNADYFTSMHNMKMQTARGISRVAAQDEYVADGMEKSDTDYYEYLFVNTTNGTDDVEFVDNGYAVYLSDPSTTVLQRNDMYISSVGNSGVIKVTDKGIYGVDLVLYTETTEVVENVELLDFEKIQESLKNALEEKLELDKLGVTDGITINGNALMYEPCYEDDASGNCSMIPVWQFTVTGDHIKSGPDGITGMAVITINAMDGSVNSFDDGSTAMFGYDDGEVTTDVSDGEDE